MTSTSLVRQRGGHKGYITRILKNIPAAITANDITQITSYKSALERHLGSIQQIDEKLLNAIEEEGAHVKAIEENEKFYAEVISHIVALEDSLIERSVSLTVSSNIRHAQPDSNANSFVKLLPKKALSCIQILLTTGNFN